MELIETVSVGVSVTLEINGPCMTASMEDIGVVSTVYTLRQYSQLKRRACKKISMNKAYILVDSERNDCFANLPKYILLTCCGVTWFINCNRCITLPLRLYGCHTELNGNTDIGEEVFQITCVDTHFREVCTDSVVTDVWINVCYVQRFWSFPKQSTVRSTLIDNSQVTGGSSIPAQNDCL